MTQTKSRRGTFESEAVWEPVQLGPRRIEPRRGWLQLRDPSSRGGRPSLADLVIDGFARRGRAR